MNSHEVFIHVQQGCFAGTGAIVGLPQCQWGKPDGYGKISQCITTTKDSKTKTVCIFLGIYMYCSIQFRTFLSNYIKFFCEDVIHYQCAYCSDSLTNFDNRKVIYISIYLYLFIMDPVVQLNRHIYIMYMWWFSGVRYYEVVKLASLHFVALIFHRVVSHPDLCT